MAETKAIEPKRITSQPIWDDTGFTGASPLKYDVKIGGTIIYSGVAVAKPNESSVRVSLRDIVKGYLYQTFPDTSVTGEALPIDTLQVAVDVVVSGMSHTFNFRYDWSYRYDNYLIDNKLGILSDSITGRISPRQYLLMTKIGKYGSEPEDRYWIEYVNKDTGDAELQEVYDAMDIDFNGVFFAPDSFKPTYCTIDAVSNGSVKYLFAYDVTEGCERYCLYYVNARGGWDSLLIEGEGMEIDSNGHRVMDVEHNSSDNVPTNRKVYANNIKKRFELHTGWLTGDEGSRMHNLLNSTLVYLHDMDKDEIYPVIISNSECAYKTYHNNGNKLVDYTINVEVARDYRRE